MAEHMLNDQQQQEQQPQQLPHYGVDFGVRPKPRALPYVKAVPHVPIHIGVPNIRAKPLPAPSAREHQQHQVMLQEGDMLANQPLIQQHNIQQQDNIACNHRYDQLHKRVFVHDAHLFVIGRL